MKFVKIEGIHCDNCINKITKSLLKMKKIKDVDIKNNIAYIEYTGDLKNEDVIRNIANLGYITKDDYISDNVEDLNSKIKLYEFVIILFIVLLTSFLINTLFGFNIFNVIPNIDSNITYGMLFITGLLTSIHCVSMCGAINLLAIFDNKNSRNFKRPILYNLGRIIAYSLVGGLVGLIGSVISINSIVNGVIIGLASVVMLFMALSMLGVIRFRILPYKIRFKNRTQNAFIIGLLNGLMPCGPLQAMQVYALSTGSFVNGALSMFLFALGTVPLMLTIGFVYNFMNGKWRILINKIVSILIFILSLVMLNRGLLAFNIDVSKIFKNYGDFTSTEMTGKYQVIEFDLDYTDYEDILVQVGVPVRMVIHVDKQHLTGCNNEIVMRDFGIRKKLEIGDNIIEFTPNKTGVFAYTCWMGMVRNHIKVIDDKGYFKIVK